MFINKLSAIRSVILPTTRSLLQPRLIHSVKKPAVPVSSSEYPDSSNSTSKSESDNSNNNQTNSNSSFLSEIESQPKILSTNSKAESHPDGFIPDVRQDQDHPKTVKHQASRAGNGSTNRTFSTSAKQFNSPESGEVNGGNDRIKGGSEGVEVGQGNIGKDGGEGKKETERNVSDQVKIGASESDIGKMGGNQFGGGNGGGGAGAQIGSSSNQKRGFSTSIFRRVEGERTGSKGTPKGESKGEGLEHLKENQPSKSEEAVHAEKHGKNTLEESSRKLWIGPKTRNVLIIVVDLAFCYYVFGHYL